MEWLGSSTGRRVIALVVGIVALAGIARAVSSARADADLLRAPERDAVDALAGTSAPSDTTSVPSLSPFAVADSMFGQSGKLRFRTLTRVAAIALPGFIKTYGEQAIRTPAVHHVAANGGPTPFAFIVLRPFGEKW